MFIAPHMHHARMTLTHAELSAQYGLRENVQLTLRLPYDVKDLRIRYATLAGAAYIPPYGDIHHRTETLSGVSDPSLGIDWAAGNWMAGAGITLPLGRTEPDPIALGRDGITHQHIQFGSGTVQPRLTMQYMRPRFSGRLEATFSLYENSEGFRAPSNLIWSGGPTFIVRGVGILPRLEGHHQTLGRWSGELDEGSGFTNGGIRLRLSFPAGPYFVSPSIYRELFSQGRHEESFQQGTSWSLGISRTF